MIIFELTRDVGQNLPCTQGVMRCGELKLQTIERPWIPSTVGGLGGEPFRSCVPPGLYKLERFTRPSGEKVFMLTNPQLDIYGLERDIPSSRKGLARYLCLIHTANYVHDVVGCIGPGMKRYHDGHEWMVTDSKSAMIALRNTVGSDFDLKLRIQ